MQEEEMRDMDEAGMKSFGALDRSEKTTAILGGQWCPQMAEQDGDEICERFLLNRRKKRYEHIGVSVTSRNGAPFR